MKKQPPAETETTKPTAIESLDQLQALVDAPVYALFALDNQPLKVPCRRADQALQEQVRALRRKAQPPRMKEAGPNGDHYDYGNLAYQEAHERNTKIARALLVYSGCPMVSAKKPGLTDASQIHEFVKTILSENILEIIAGTVEIGGIGMVERVDFTSAAGSGN